MNTDQARVNEVVTAMMSMLDDAIAHCHRCATGLDKTEQHIALLADEMASSMPINDKTVYTHAALSQIAASTAHE